MQFFNSQDLMEHETDGDVSSAPSGEHEPELLNAREDLYDGMIVELDNSPSDVARFVSSLKASLVEWEKKGKKGVWIKVPIAKTNLVPALIEVLVVQEKNGAYRGSGIWKMPTGLLVQGEDIFNGVVREVKEETGIDAKFLEVAVLRHFHNAPFNKSDLNLICILQPLSFVIKIQETEIEAAKWMPFKEFAAQPKYRESELYKKIFDVCIASFEKRYKGFSEIQIASASSGPQTVLYYNVQDMNDFNQSNGVNI
ncbi:nudix hydrolase 8 isoform X4 [Cryptomeria japonica]|uniref:nudix hydrolase 8 isoform X4 n=1 Tax=Cryptomeria japonica TaxID=3369 RepID=UPI0025AB70C3|nr:nudix hydrolase 8 isoform X4 [Cryptomeria japonica]